MSKSRFSILWIPPKKDELYQILSYVTKIFFVRFLGYVTTDACVKLPSARRLLYIFCNHYPFFDHTMMNFQVVYKVWGLAESVLTFRAHRGSLSRMKPEMLRMFSEGFSKASALTRFLLRMELIMLSELWGSAETFPTQLTLEGPLFCMYPIVLNELWTSTEGSATVTTLMGSLSNIVMFSPIAN